MRRPSGTMQMPCLTILSGLSLVISFSLKRIFPLRGFTMPATVRSMVLFPAPFAPMMETISPLATSRLTSSRAFIGP